MAGQSPVRKTRVRLTYVTLSIYSPPQKGREAALNRSNRRAEPLNRARLGKQAGNMSSLRRTRKNKFLPLIVSYP
jgi:hypothetical protein